MEKNQVRVPQLRVFQGVKKTYDASGKQNNPSQLLKLVHESREWANFKKYFNANRYLNVEVVGCINKNTGKSVKFDDITAELEELMTAPAKELTTDEKLAALSSQMDEMRKSGGKTDEDVQNAADAAYEKAENEAKSKIEEKDQVISEKDEEIEKLKAQLAEQGKANPVKDAPKENGNGNTQAKDGKKGE